jgi:hypothetical protein
MRGKWGQTSCLSPGRCSHLVPKLHLGTKMIAKFYLAGKKCSQTQLWNEEITVSGRQMITFGGWRLNDGQRWDALCFPATALTQIVSVPIYLRES